MQGRNINLLLLILITVFLLGLPLSVSGEDPSPDESVCPALVSVAMEKTDLNCEGTGRDQVCYGHDSLSALPQANVDSFIFETAGDKEDLYKLKTLRLSALDEEANNWGIALMQLGADTPANEPDQNTTLLLFGDVAVENMVLPPAIFETTIAVNSFVNVRRGPSETAGVLSTLGSGAPVQAIGRLADNSWIRVILPQTGRAGWLFRPLVAGEDAEIERLIVEEAWTPHYGPMQAFFLENGSAQGPSCASAPTDGLLIQTPEGVAEINLLLNEVDIHLAATTLVQAHPGEDLTIAVLDGWVEVEAKGSKQTAVAGSQVRISLNEQGIADAAPVFPEPLNTDRLHGLPLDLLDNAVEIPTALTTEEIILLVSDDPDESVSGEADATDGKGKSGLHGNSENAPGNSGNAPGHSGDAPGNSGDNPGHGGEPPGQAKDKPNKDN